MIVSRAVPRPPSLPGFGFDARLGPGADRGEAARAARTDWTRLDVDKLLAVPNEAHGGGSPLRGAAASRNEAGAAGQVLLGYDPRRGSMWGEVEA